MNLAGGCPDQLLFCETTIPATVNGFQNEV